MLPNRSTPSSEKKKSSFFKRTLVSASLALLGASISGSAYADFEFRFWENTTYRAFVAAVDNQFYAINTYLAQIYGYLASGDGDTGTGVIGTMNKIWEQDRMYSNDMANQQSSWGRRSALDAVPANAIVNKIPDPRTCSEIAATMGARGYGGGGGGGRRSKGLTELKVSAQQAGTKFNDTQYASDLYATRKSSGYCSASDANFLDQNGNPVNNRGAFGCSAGDVHKMPDADARVQSILRPAHDYTDPNAVETYGSSLTYNNGNSGPSPVGDQSRAADDAILSIVARFSPPSLPREVEQSSAGRVFLTKIKTFNARISPAIDFFTTAKSRLDSSQNTLPDSAVSLSDFKDFFARMFPRATVPSKPSDAEILRYEVLRRYADPTGSWATQLQAASGDATKLAFIQAQSQAVELYMLYNLHERLLENNALLSSMLAQSMNPITKAELQNNAAQITK